MYWVLDIGARPRPTIKPDLYRSNKNLSLRFYRKVNAVALSRAPLLMDIF